MEYQRWDIFSSVRGVPEFFLARILITTGLRKLTRPTEIPAKSGAIPIIFEAAYIKRPVSSNENINQL